MKVGMKTALGVLAIALIAAIVLLSFQSLKPKETQNITVKLAWLHQSQFAGIYVAKERGFYAEEGLNATIVPFSFEDPTIDAVANGKADFGIVGSDELIIARSKGLPLKAFAVIYKINPVCAYSLKESGISKPQDFIGKTVGLQRGTNVEYLYFVMMSKLGIDRSKIKEVSISYGADELLNGTIDVSTGYIIDEPQQAILGGHEVNTILMADYGADMYADVLFATDDTIKSNPELVRKFLRATLKGWSYSIEHEEEAIDAVMKYTIGENREFEKRELEASIPLINAGNSPLGMMEESKWMQAYQILKDHNMLSAALNIGDAYTMDFLEKIYSGGK